MAQIENQENADAALATIPLNQPFDEAMNVCLADDSCI